MARGTLAPGGYIGGEPPRQPYLNRLSGMWKLDDVVERQKANTWSNPLGIEDLFSTWLYTGNGSTRTITNGIDLANKGGLVWLKKRSDLSDPHYLIDTERGVTKSLNTNNALGEATNAVSFNSFNNNGFSIGASPEINSSSGHAMVSWTFRKAPKFFDVVTYTGTGGVRTVPHNLGSVPGCIIVKRTDSTGGSWSVYHRSLANTEFLTLDSTAAKGTGSDRWGSTTPTSTEFTLGNTTQCNAPGTPYVAYLFAHDAGGFGNSGNESVIKCGSYANNSSQAVEVNLGWEPQWVLIKSVTGNGWVLTDVMRGMNVVPSDTTTGCGPALYPNVASIETANSAVVKPTPTGFKVQYNIEANQNSAATTGTVTYVYIAIRRGPMKAPTSGATVFQALARTATFPNLFNTTLPYVDLIIDQGRTGQPALAQTRLIGNAYQRTNVNDAESAGSVNPFSYNNQVNPTSWIGSGTSEVNWMFRRAPGFFDAVTYTGTGAARTIPHNLGVAPELMIVKARNGAFAWLVYSAALGNNASLTLNDQSAINTPATVWNQASPTSSVFTVGTSNAVNGSGYSYVAYLFASCPGVSQIGTYVASSTEQFTIINCGFQPRFIMIKRTDGIGDWIVLDHGRNIVSSPNPYLSLNNNLTENGMGYVNSYSGSFEVENAFGDANYSAAGSTYLYMAIA